MSAPTDCRPGLTAAFLFSLALFAACSGDPARQIESHRSKYTASLTGFVVREAPGVAGPQIVLDVLVAGGSKPPLAGLTLDISMAAADGREKAHRRIWIESATVGVSGEQRALTLDGLDFQPGDGFWVGVRAAVPVAERGDYREFGAAP